MSQPTVDPEWNSTPATNNVDPGAGQKASGWTVNQVPPSSWFNWWMRAVWQWCLYLKNLSGEAFTWTAAHIFQSTMAVKSITNAGTTIDTNVIDVTAGGTGIGVKAYTAGAGGVGVDGFAASALGIGVRGGSSGVGGAGVRGAGEKGVAGYANFGGLAGIYGESFAVAAPAGVFIGPTGDGTAPSIPEAALKATGANSYTLSRGGAGARLIGGAGVNAHGGTAISAQGGGVSRTVAGSSLPGDGGFAQGGANTGVNNSSPDAGSGFYAVGGIGTGGANGGTGIRAVGGSASGGGVAGIAIVANGDVEVQGTITATGTFFPSGGNLATATAQINRLSSGLIVKAWAYVRWVSGVYTVLAGQNISSVNTAGVSAADGFLRLVFSTGIPLSTRVVQPHALAINYSNSGQQNQAFSCDYLGAASSSDTVSVVRIVDRGVVGGLDLTTTTGYLSVIVMGFQ